MQSKRRQLKRINSGLQNAAPKSTKISKNTNAEKLGFDAYRKNRFMKMPLGGFVILRNISFRKFALKVVFG